LSAGLPLLVFLTGGSLFLAKVNNMIESCPQGLAEQVCALFPWIERLTTFQDPSYVCLRVYAHFSV
jgi:hypothetical protein